MKQANVSAFIFNKKYISFYDIKN